MKQERTHLFQLHNAEKGQPDPGPPTDEMDDLWEAVNGAAMVQQNTTQRGTRMKGCQVGGPISCLMLFTSQFILAINTMVKALFTILFMVDLCKNTDTGRSQCIAMSIGGNAFVEVLFLVGVFQVYFSQIHKPLLQVVLRMRMGKENKCFYKTG